MSDRFINLAQPDLGGRETEYVNECLSSGWISSIGRFIGEFERGFSEFVGVDHAVATNNGTTALHLALVALGVKPGDEVIVPSVTYVASANAVAYCGATAVLVDVEPGTLNIDPVAVEAAITDKTVAVIAVHLYGIPARMPEINAICKPRNIWVVEDAAEAHGAKIGDKAVGSLSDVAIFSFFGNKILTTGEGGMVTTNDADLADRLRLFRGQGMDPERRYWFPVVGYNYRMTNIAAAIGVAQLERYDDFIAKRTLLTNRYEEKLASVSALLEEVHAPEGYSRVPWLFNIFPIGIDAARRDAIMTSLKNRGVDSRPVFYPMHVLPAFESDEDFPVSDEWSARGISLPLHTGLTIDDIDYVTAAVVDVLRELLGASS